MEENKKLRGTYKCKERKKCEEVRNGKLGTLLTKV